MLSKPFDVHVQPQNVIQYKPALVMDLPLRTVMISRGPRQLAHSRYTVPTGCCIQSHVLLILVSSSLS